MSRKLAEFGDRMLSRLVPGIKAQAATCIRAPQYDDSCNSYMLGYKCTNDGVYSYYTCKYS
ncbi:hypothetical protein [Actinoplanes teichomyceticus]|uniref:Uncharacterized protein n=1 Tax=Actinoplanes teichomyceticus TaxID=1867 RepID=A0A561VGX9_ACTTI|nr:hypothetical protein [Actinoplanes teichomyceticus]TWG10882.1 hypothetical protein FHX34_107380 [Actinoplanes teichomyceticus]GIF12497.1 hypothetical protein Ate01nite_25290 [Actinoplanes teichomyceticus]